MKIKLLLSIVLSGFLSSLSAREGMWLPQLLKELNETDMKTLGMEISAEDIYSVNHSSLKDAVIHFGGGCTGEIISPKGLLVTNHHCGFSQIQSLSTIEKNHLANGFWAKSNEEELHCPGLTVTFIKEITDVTKIVLEGIGDEFDEDTRTAKIKSKTDSLEKTVTGSLKASVRQFYHGNKFYIFIMETYSDIRLVGAPPQSIGKFGGETDNWMWPRHTGDFALFRIYADKDNKPAAHSKSNVPFVPKKFLTINISGVDANDFVMMMGFPGRTNEYMLSPALEVVAAQTNPNRIEIRNTRLDILRDAMRKNDTIKLQYSSKFSTLENACKKWEGEQVGFERSKAVEIKKRQEEDFFSRISRMPALARDSALLREYKQLNDKARPLNHNNDYFAEAFPGMELVMSTGRLKTLVELSEKENPDQKAIEEEIGKTRNSFRGFYKNYNSGLDRKICTAVLNLSCARLDKRFVPETVQEYGKPDFFEFTDEMFAKSLIADSNRFMKFLDEFKPKNVKKIKTDKAYQLAIQISVKQKLLQAELAELNKQMNKIQRKYMNDLLILDKDGRLFPDANSTMRVSYGKVEGTKPKDGMTYNYYTTADGILEKNALGIYDYKIPPGLADLIRSDDYGPYGEDGSLPVAFLSSVHSTGGNSGSPVLNGRGELVGINYDRMWEGVLSDYYYDESISRNISLDIRYALFVIEKFGKAGNLISEMKIVRD